MHPAKTNDQGRGPGPHSAMHEGAAPEVLGASQREQVDRILHSAAFQGRDALKRLFSYLVDRTIDGSAGDLKEYTIGIEVFHKPDGYDPQHDGSVRQHIAKLRQKLDEYYRLEGTADPMRIELPKRQFRLEFQDFRKPRISRWRLRAPGIAIGGLVALLPVAFWLGSLPGTPAGSELDPAVRRLWAPFLESARQAVVCLGTPLFLRNRSFRVRDSHLNVTDTPEAQAEIRDFAKRLGLNSLVSNFDYTGIGEAYAAFDVARVFAVAHRQLRLTRANALSWNDVRDENVIFLGPAKFNPHLAALTRNLELTVDDVQVNNRHPLAGESPVYGRISDANGDAEEDYVLIDWLPGIDSVGRILILEGGSTSSNWAAADYITHPATAQELLSRIQLRDGTLPQFFQMLLRVKYQAAVPTETNLILFRPVQQR